MNRTGNRRSERATSACSSAETRASSIVLPRPPRGDDQNVPARWRLNVLAENLEHAGELMVSADELRSHLIVGLEQSWIRLADPVGCVQCPSPVSRFVVRLAACERGVMAAEVRCQSPQRALTIKKVAAADPTAGR